MAGRVWLDLDLQPDGKKDHSSFGREGLAGSGSATRWQERSQVHWAGRVCLDLDPLNNGKKDQRFIR